MEDFRNIDLDQYVRTHSRRQIFENVEKLKAAAEEADKNAFLKKIAKDLEQAYARYMRPERALTLLLELRRAGRRGKLITHPMAKEICDNDSHFEEGHILKYLGQICIANKWPPYPSLVVREQSGECGDGFFSAYGIGGPPDARNLIAKSMQEACFASYLPTHEQVLAAFKEADQKDQ